MGRRESIIILKVGQYVTEFVTLSCNLQETGLVTVVVLKLVALQLAVAEPQDAVPLGPEKVTDTVLFPYPLIYDVVGHVPDVITGAPTVAKNETMSFGRFEK